MGFPQPVAFKLFASLLPTAISERRADFNTPRKSTNPLKTKTYEKPNNINRYRQYRCGPGINIRMRDYRHWRDCGKPARRCRNRRSSGNHESDGRSPDGGTVSLPYIRDRRTEPDRSPTVRWIWA